MLLAGGLIFCNQVCFVYGLKFTQASTVGLLLGATPMFIGAISASLGLEHLGRSFWVGAIVTVLGVACVALSSGHVDSNPRGVLLALALALTWSAYSIVIGPLFLTNVLWFTAIDRVGPSRAALFANLEPFLAVLFAVLLLSDRLDAIEILGAVLILAGIVLERVWHQSTASAMSALD